jgi:hypothetical protein
MTVSKAMAKPIGTFLKAFLSTILTLWLVKIQEGHELFSGDMAMVKTLLTGGIVANLPVIINWLNPQYKGYGK